MPGLGMLGVYLTYDNPRGVWGENESSLLAESKWRSIRTITGTSRFPALNAGFRFRDGCYREANNADNRQVV